MRAAEAIRAPMRRAVAADIDGAMNRAEVNCAEMNRVNRMPLGIEPR